MCLKSQRSGLVFAIIRHSKSGRLDKETFATWIRKVFTARCWWGCPKRCAETRRPLRALSKANGGEPWRKPGAMGKLLAA